MIFAIRPRRIRVYSPKDTCLIIGITSLAVFLLNILALLLVADLHSIQWRSTFLEQVGNRSIALLLGFGLIFYGFSDRPSLRKQSAFVCLMAGILFQMSCILLIHDTQALQTQAADNITQQAQQVKLQIQQSQSDPANAQEADRVVQQLEIQEKELQQQAKTDITRAGVISLGNLLIPGMGLLGLGWVGLKKP